MSEIIPVILSGGIGSRLWPVSRSECPKPFIRLADGESLLQKTVRRAGGLPGVRRVLTVTHDDYFDKTQAEYATCPALEGVALEYILEPVGRNTGPAIVMAAQYLEATQGPEAVMLVLPADHLIEPQPAFEAAVGRAAALAQRGYLATFGIPATAPETGYGYIEVAEEMADLPGCFAVQRFVEKPPLERAQGYCQAGDALWNSGMFCFTVGSVLAAAQSYAPDLYAMSKAHEDSASWLGQAGQPLRLEADRYRRFPDLSFDVAVMERADKVAVVKGDFSWSDVGCWHRFSEQIPTDPHGNRVLGDSVLLDTRNTFIQGGRRVVATIGLENIAIIDTPDALLITRLDRANDVSKVVKELKARDDDA